MRFPAIVLALTLGFFPILPTLQAPPTLRALRRTCTQPIFWDSVSRIRSLRSGHCAAVVKRRPQMHVGGTSVGMEVPPYLDTLACSGGQRKCLALTSTIGFSQRCWAKAPGNRSVAQRRSFSWADLSSAGRIAKSKSMVSCSPCRSHTATESLCMCATARDRQRQWIAILPNFWRESRSPASAWLGREGQINRTLHELQTPDNPRASHRHPAAV
jgi:hypothetical protein